MEEQRRGLPFFLEVSGDGNGEIKQCSSVGPGASVGKALDTEWGTQILGLLGPQFHLCVLHAEKVIEILCALAAPCMQ